MQGQWQEVHKVLDRMRWHASSQRGYLCMQATMATSAATHHQ